MTVTDALARLILDNAPTVFFGGAGVSTESGIPDFRSVDGLYNQTWDAPPETILSHAFFMRRTEDFYRFYREKMLFPDAKPNKAHIALAALEKRGLVSAVVTQNIDGLHQAAGSQNVVELHGSVHRNRCTACGKPCGGYDFILRAKGVPTCACGGVIKPDVVLYGESLPEDAIERALKYMDSAKLLIVGGTSLSVYPAAAFADGFSGKLAVLNRTPTRLDARADYLSCGLIGATLDACVRAIAEAS